MESSKETALEYLEMLKKRFDILSDADRTDYFEADDIASAICDSLDEAIARQAEAEGWYPEYAKIMEIPEDHPLMRAHEQKKELGGVPTEEAIVDGSLSHAEIDPKGHVVLERNGDDALVFLGSHAVQPYVIAYGYDEATGGWAYGAYFSDIARAEDEFNPEIIAGMTLRWEREDFREELRCLGYDERDADFEHVLNIAIGETRSYFYGLMCETGREWIEEDVQDAAKSFEAEKSSPSLKDVSDQVKNAPALDGKTDKARSIEER